MGQEKDEGCLVRTTGSIFQVHGVCSFFPGRAEYFTNCLCSSSRTSLMRCWRSCEVLYSRPHQLCQAEMARGEERDAAPGRPATDSPVNLSSFHKLGACFLLLRSLKQRISGAWGPQMTTSPEAFRGNRKRQLPAGTSRDPSWFLAPGTSKLRLRAELGFQRWPSWKLTPGAVTMPLPLQGTGGPMGLLSLQFSSSSAIKSGWVLPECQDHHLFSWAALKYSKLAGSCTFDKGK